MFALTFERLIAVCKPRYYEKVAKPYLALVLILLVVGCIGG